MRRPGLVLRVTVLVVSGLIAGFVVLAVGSRSDLNDARDRVEATWARLRPVLDERYQAVGAARQAVEQRLGDKRPPLDLLDGLERALSSWRARGAIEAQVAAANQLEGLTARLAGTASATPRLRSSPEVTQAMAAVTQSVPNEDRAAYNQAVAAYEKVRGGFPRRLVAGALGFDASRTLEFPVS